MEKHHISETFFYVETKEPTGQLIRTFVFTLENGSFKAFSSYFPDNKLVGAAESNDEKQAIQLSIKDLKKVLKSRK